MTNQPDLFTNVHKGLRRALFEVCVALGRAGDDRDRTRAARSMLTEVLRFVEHHGDNEDLLLIPLLAAVAPELAGRLRAGHERIDPALRALANAAASSPIDELYVDTCAFVAEYLEHMREEEQLEPGIRAALELEQLAAFGRESVARTSPTDQRMMLAWMLPAMTAVDVEGFFAKLPGSLAAELRPLTLGPSVAS